MARPIVLGNGEMHVGINNFGQVHDLYFPYVGHENHTIGPGTRHRIGVWVDGDFSWIDSEDWSHNLNYPDAALIGHSIHSNQRLGITLEIDDAVDSTDNVLMRNIHIVNRHDSARDVRLFMHQAFVIGDTASNTDTAQYLPDSQAIVHYRGRRVFVVSGSADGGSFDQHSIGIFGIEGREGTWRDAEDGELSMSAVEHGRVDSTLRFHFAVAPYSSVRAHYWLTAGRNLRQALAIHRQIQADGLNRRFRSTARWWHNWLEPAIAVSQRIDDKPQRKLFVDSLILIKAHIDKRGAVMASLDSAVLYHGRDSYAYAWPRDGAYAVWPLIRLGYQSEALAFFDFCRRGLHPGGYLAHKYRADGTVGSSWHPYQHNDGSVTPPIQTDETAICLFMFVEFYRLNPDPAVLDDYYDGLVVPMANFLADYIDPTTQLPLPSYDLWEELWQTTTYTTAVSYAALLAAAELADTHQDQSRAVHWRAAAEDMYQAAQQWLYSQDTNCLIKGLVKTSDGYDADQTIDVSSVFGAFMFGLFPIDSQPFISSVDTVLRQFDQAERVGLPRYENDGYRRSHDGAPSNQWHITTLWYSQYCIETGDWESANRLLDWVVDHRSKSNTLSEQVDPQSGQSVSVEPLVWSHAEFVTTMLDKITKQDAS